MSDGPNGPGEYGSSSYDDFLARFFGAGPGGPVRRVDIGQLMTEQTRELVREAASQAAAWGDSDLDTDHLLWALTRQEPTRRLLAARRRRPGRDRAARSTPGPAAASRGVDRRRLRRAQSAPCSTRTRSRGRWARPISGPSTCCSPWRSTPSPRPGGSCAARGSPRRRCSTRWPAGGGPGGARGGGRRPGRLLGHADARRVRPRPDRAGARGPRSTRSSGGTRRSSRPIEVLSRRTKNNPVLIGEPGVGKTAIVEGIAQRIVDGRRPARPSGTSASSSSTWPGWWPAPGTAATSRSG